MHKAAEAVFRRGLQHLWPTAGGQLTSAEMYTFFLNAGLYVPMDTLQVVWDSLLARGLITGSMASTGGFVITGVDPSLLMAGKP
jgi:hypothetical protein